MSDREEEKGFVVTDRRRFTETGEARPEADAPPAGAASAARDAIEGGPKGPDPEVEPPPPGAARPPGRIDFTTFVFSLGSSALMHLGDAPHPETGEPARNLELARETIDLLAMLQEKTKGNLTPEEDRFLGALLYDLRVRFIEAAKKA
ncbi:MAG TPA: DUF1844 domain-containing protein [Vulgatibacter sp.]|nr:DUF1844 domain-containing protein [Vulgatibacter sp.]